MDRPIVLIAALLILITTLTAPALSAQEPPPEPPSDASGDAPEPAGEPDAGSIPPGDSGEPVIGPNGAVVLPGANQQGDNRPGYDPLAPDIASDKPSVDSETPLPPGDQEVQGKVAEPAVSEPAGELDPAPTKVPEAASVEQAGGAFQAPTIQTGVGSSNSASKSGGSDQLGQDASSYWRILLTLIVFAVILYTSFWRVMIRRFDDLDARLESAIRPLTDGQASGARRLSERRALLLLGASTGDPAPLPSEGLSFGIADGDDCGAVTDRLVAGALLHCPGSVVVVSARALDDVVKGALTAASPGDPPAAAALASRVVVVGTQGMSVGALAKMVRRVTNGQGVVVLEHPRWLADLDGPTRASWVLARLDERLATLSELSGVGVWIACAEGALSPGSSAVESRFVAGWLKLEPKGAGLSRSGRFGSTEVDDVWGQEA